MIFQELKKVFRPKYCLIALAILMVLCARVPRQQAAAVKYARTDAYPERFFIYDGYSVDILFQDFLLQTYGKTVMSDVVPDLEQRREALLTQIQASADQDPVLQRCGTFFDRETAQFCGKNPDQSLSEEDQIYLFSCINGQLRLDGTDYPVGFLSAMDSVLEQLRQNGSYQVLGSDLLSLLRRNLGIVTAFSLAGLALVIPYGVSEARSGMVRLAYTTKRGRRSYTDKLLTIFVTGVGITFLGVLLAILLFSGLGVRRFWDCRILDAMAALRTGCPVLRRNDLSGILRFSASVPFPGEFCRRSAGWADLPAPAESRVRTGLLPAASGRNVVLPPAICGYSAGPGRHCPPGDGILVCFPVRCSCSIARYGRSTLHSG